MMREIIEAARAELWRRHKECGDAMRAFPRGPMGLTPDSVRAMPEWQVARAAADKAFAELRAFNTRFPPQRRKPAYKRGAA